MQLALIKFACETIESWIENLEHLGAFGSVSLLLCGVTLLGELRL